MTKKQRRLQAEKVKQELQLRKFWKFEYERERDVLILIPTLMIKFGEGISFIWGQWMIGIRRDCRMA